MQSGNDPDQMQIRVVNKQGTSNSGNLKISSPSVSKSRYPISGTITQNFGEAWSRNPDKTHTGVDIAAPKNTAIPSMGAGKVAHIHDLTGADGHAVIVQEDTGAIRGYLLTSRSNGQKK